MEFKLNADKKRKLIVVFIIILLLSFMEPFLLAALFAYGIYAIKKVRIYKSRDAVRFDDAAFKFKAEKYSDAIDMLDYEFKYDEIQEDADMMKAYCYYGLKDYEKLLSSLEKISPDKLQYNYTLLLAKGEALEKVNRKEDANNLYGELIKKFPKSKFLKDKLEINSIK